MKFLSKHQVALAYLFAALTWLPLIGGFNGGWQGDTSIYRDDAEGIVQGRGPYRDLTVEYPPYALGIFLAPKWCGYGNYLDAFRILTAFCELLIRGSLFWVGTRGSHSSRRWLPLISYAVAIPFLCAFLFQRYDLWPALICLVATIAFARGKILGSGLLIALGIGVKLYPVLFVLPLFVLAWRRGKGGRFLTGLAIGLAPLFLLVFFMPWWRFLFLQGSRGLQCESLFASLIWGLHRLGLADVDWLYVFRWFEVRGEVVTAVLPISKAVFFLAVLLSEIVSCLAAARSPNLGVGRIARLLLLPLLGFVAFNQVFSPQYMIWLLPLAALGTLEGNPWPPVAVAFATMLTPIIFPSFGGDYGKGLNGWETMVLIMRNLILVAVWWIFLVEHWRIWQDRNSEASQSNAVATL